VLLWQQVEGRQGVLLLSHSISSAASSQSPMTVQTN
jgi:hypothetical protein